MTDYTENMTAEDKKALQRYGQEWTAANSAGDAEGKATAHSEAEAIRAKYGFSGGANGSQQIDINKLNPKSDGVPTNNTVNANPLGNDVSELSGAVSNTANSVTVEPIKSDLRNAVGPVDTPTLIAPKNSNTSIKVDSSKSISDSDSKLLEQLGLQWVEADKAGDEEGKAEAHRLAELVRGKYNYSGGSDGLTDTEITRPDDGKSYVDGEGNSFSDKDVRSIQDYGTDWEVNNFLYGRTNDEAYNSGKSTAHENAQYIRSKYGVTADSDGIGTYDIKTGEDFLAVASEITEETISMDTLISSLGATLDGNSVLDKDGNTIGELYTDENGKQQIRFDVTTTKGVYGQILESLATGKSEAEFYTSAMKDLIESSGEVFDESSILSYEDALERAEEMIGGLYDNKREEYRDNLDADALSRGMLNQLPNEAYMRGKLEEFENTRDSEIASLANQLRGQSFDEATQMASIKSQEITNKLSVLLAGLQSANLQNSMMVDTLSNLMNFNYKDAEIESATEQQEFNNKAVMASITGYWDEDGMRVPTMDLQKTLHAMGMDEAKTAQMIKESDASISQAWARISDNRKSLELATQRYGLELRGQELQEKEFNHLIQSDALEMTYREIASLSPEFDTDYYEYLVELDALATQESKDEAGFDPDLGRWNDYDVSVQSKTYLEDFFKGHKLDLDTIDFKELYDNNYGFITNQLGIGIDNVIPDKYKIK